MPRCHRGFWVSFALLTASADLASSLRAQPSTHSPGQTSEATAAGAQDAAKANVVKMTLHAAAAPDPAMKHALLPEVRDLKPGNAALLYQRAHSLEWWLRFLRAGEGDKIAALLDLPLRKMPRHELVLAPAAFREIELAARREYCDWELTPRLREEGYALLIPDVQAFRTYGDIVALRTRLAMLDGNIDQAVRDMQTGLALSRHVGEAPTIVNALVGMAIAHAMFNQLEDFVQRDKAPNLYWALADLPRPFMDVRRPMQGEKVGIASMFPEIRAALNDRTQPPVPGHTIQKYLDNLRYSGDKVAADRLVLTLTAARTYPRAKEYLLARGFAPDQVSALPVMQVYLMHGLAVIDEIYDDVYKWHSLPYWQARPGLVKARHKFERLRLEQPETMYLPSMLMPALNDVIFAKARLERRPALLQVVEALRLHAASAGQLPDRLEDIHGVPLPVDPVTGRSFEYFLETNRAVLYAPPPPGEAVNDRNAIRYELTLVPMAKK